MIESDRTKIFNALVGRTAKMDKKTKKIIEDACARDLNILEPIIDEIVIHAIRSTFAHGCVIVSEETGTTECNCGQKVFGGGEGWRRHVEICVMRPN